MAIKKLFLSKKSLAKSLWSISVNKWTIIYSVNIKTHTIYAQQCKMKDFRRSPEEMENTNTAPQNNACP